MHKQLLSTAFAAFLALALVICAISPMAESAEDTFFAENTAVSAETTFTANTTQTEAVSETETETETEAQTEAVTEPEAEEKTTAEPIEKSPISPTLTIPDGAKPLSLYINGRAIGSNFAFELDGIIWLPIDAFEELLGSNIIKAEAGLCYIESGDRLIPCSKSDCEVTVREYGVLCAPIEALLSAAGLRSTEIIGDEICIWGVPTFPEADDIYSYEDLYWLSRIISAEARGEPFIGQLAVGTVVLNRTRSHYYPDTVYKVIFDRVGGVQFTPASTGSVYREPTESSVIAAKLCLEGFSLDPTILFFFNSSIAAGSWITANREYTMTVGRHDFYS